MKSISANYVQLIRQGPWKLLVRRGELDTMDSAEADELYNLAYDPAEATNLVVNNVEKVRELRAVLARYRSQGGSRPRWSN